MEADAARASALLRNDDETAAAGIEYEGQNAPTALAEVGSVPATWRLPSSREPMDGASRADAFRAGHTVPAQSSQWPQYAMADTDAAPDSGSPAAGGAVESPAEGDLPDPADLPPLTPEMQQRLESLRAHIEHLKGELQSAMLETEDILARQAARPRAGTATPELVDRRL